MNPLAALLAAADLATPGPWGRDARYPFVVKLVAPTLTKENQQDYCPYLIAEMGPHKVDANTENCEFIALVRNSIPQIKALLARLKEAEEVIDQAQSTAAYGTGLSHLAIQYRQRFPKEPT